MGLIENWIGGGNFFVYVDAKLFMLLHVALVSKELPALGIIFQQHSNNIFTN